MAARSRVGRSSCSRRQNDPFSSRSPSQRGRRSECRPNFVANSLAAAGGSRPALEHILALMAGVGGANAVPSALPQLRDALRRAPADLFDDGNSLWDAETICQIAIHEHRQALLRDVTLRRATLEILDRLVDAGSSLAFQLRDYFATSATEREAVAG